MGLQTFPPGYRGEPARVIGHPARGIGHPFQTLTMHHRGIAVPDGKGRFHLAADFSFDGLAGVLARLERFGDVAIAAADEAVQEAALEGAGAVSANVPVLTGALRATIRHEHLKWGLAVISAGEGVDYAKAVESRRAFFNRSVKPIQLGLLERVSDAIQKAAFK